jgi:nucleotide-binding universal stress UspA family protein
MPAPENNMMEQMLVAHDGSDSARKAFDFAVDLAARLGARLRMICVEEEIPRHAEVIDELLEEKDRADSYFGQLAEQCRTRAAMQSVDLETVIVPGHVVKMIGDFVQQNSIDLLVIGFTGHSRIYEHPLGRHCPQPHQHCALQRAGGQIAGSFMGPQLPLVGMEKERLRLSSAFRAGDSLLLLGPRGSGKTRLTKEVLSGCDRVLYIPWAPTLHGLLIAMARALIAARHTDFAYRAKPHADAEAWLKEQTSMRLKGLLWGTMETSPAPMMLDGVGRRLRYLSFPSTNLPFAGNGTFR